MNIGKNIKKYVNIFFWRISSTIVFLPMNNAALFFWLVGKLRIMSLLDFVWIKLWNKIQNNVSFVMMI